MRHSMTAGLAAFALLLAVAVTPGAATASDGGYAPVAKACKASHVDQGYRNVGQCVKALVRRPSSVEPSPFQTTCESLSGSYAPTGLIPGTGTPVAPACGWADMTSEEFAIAMDTLRDLCQPGEIATGEFFFGSGAIIGCRSVDA